MRNIKTKLEDVKMNRQMWFECDVCFFFGHIQNSSNSRLHCFTLRLKENVQKHNRKHKHNIS